MDEDYQKAQEEIKTAQKLKDEILRNITQIKLPKGFTITFEKEWIFPDQYTFKSERFGKRLCLRQNGIAIGLLNFTISPSNIIDIYSIQGVKSAKNKPPKDWAKLLTDTFITACLPRLIKDNSYKLHYYGQKELDGEKSYYKRLVEEINDPRIKETQKIENRLVINILENKKKFIKIILGTYFDKDGLIYFYKDDKQNLKLNTKRLRTQELLKRLVVSIPKEYTKPKISPFKRREAKRKIVTRRI